MSFTIKLIELAASGKKINQYIKTYKPDTDPWGLGTLITTPDVTLAMTFESASDARSFWGQRSKRVPDRPDGKPNKPLTAYHIEIAPVSVASFFN